MKDGLQELERQLQIANKDIEKRRGLSELDKIKLQISRIENDITQAKDEESIRMSFSVFGFLAGFVTTLSFAGALAGLGLGKLLDDGSERLGMSSKMSFVDIIKSTPRNIINLINYTNSDK